MPKSDGFSAFRNFDDLLAYLDEELGWPLQGYQFEDLTFSYEPQELGLRDEDAAKIKRIHQLRPLETGQPWGIFFVEFDRKKLPVVVLRRILGHLVIRKRASANKAERAAWITEDLLFVSAFGEDNTAQREIAFAHFHQEDGDLPTLRVLGWDGADTPLKLAHIAATLKERLQWPTNPSDHPAWRQQWSRAFRHRVGHVIRTADSLAEVLAALARKIRDAAHTIIRHESDNGPLTKLYKAFQASLIHDLTEETFADTYAQTITYGLLTAAISRTEMSEGRQGTALIAENITDMVPVTNPFLKEMLQEFLRLGGRRQGIDFDELGVQDVVELLRGEETDLPAILRDFGNKTRGEDPVIHFYEHFLSAYNKHLKIQRGVFYTPQPVVSHIVRSVHEVLQTEFGLIDGLADTITWGAMLEKHPGLKLPLKAENAPDKGTISPDEPFIQILDPATGTATFLVEVIEIIHRTLVDKWRRQGLTELQQRAAWNDYVPHHLLPRLHAFELMMAPYAIAHMKIGLKLAETGYRFGTEERARIYLTNALEPWVQQPPLIGFEALAHEAAAVNEIKRNKRFTVLVGNPPYSNFGQLNKNPFIAKLLEDYKNGLDEKKINLDDDFIKFFRFSQSLIENTGSGVLAIITNNAHLEGITHRQMRCSLITQFNCVKIIDLHGNARKAEVTAEGKPDENVFEIMQGVAISVLSKNPLRVESLCEVAHIQGTREHKYALLNQDRVSSIKFTRCLPVAPYFMFQEQHDVADEYMLGVPVSDIFISYQSPIQTKRDGLTIHFTRQELQSVLDDLSDLPDIKIREKYDLAPDGRDWTLPSAKADVKAQNGKIIKLSYKPFDFRFTYYTGKSRGFLAYPRDAIMRHMFGQGARSFVFKRQAREDAEGYTYFFTTDCPFSEGLFAIDPRGREFIAPLYLRSEDSNNRLLNLSDCQQEPNLKSEFLLRLASVLQLPQIKTTGLPIGISPEDIFHYAYAVFHSPTYRSRYAKFLRVDFPRLPLPNNLKLFRALAVLGAELTTLHLLESPKLNTPISQYIGSARAIVECVSWSANTVWLDRNQTVGFKGVNKTVWEFHIGGYQICDKWLKARKGRQLAMDDINHYNKIVVSIAETIRLMLEIDRTAFEHGAWSFNS